MKLWVLVVVGTIIAWGFGVGAVYLAIAKNSDSAVVNLLTEIGGVSVSVWFTVVLLGGLGASRRRKSLRNAIKPTIESIEVFLPHVCRMLRLPADGQASAALARRLAEVVRQRQDAEDAKLQTAIVETHDLVRMELDILSNATTRAFPYVTRESDVASLTNLERAIRGLDDAVGALKQNKDFRDRVVSALESSLEACADVLASFAKR